MRGTFKRDIGGSIGEYLGLCRVLGNVGLDSEIYLHLCSERSQFGSWCKVLLTLWGLHLGASGLEF